jgi:hypothetical protein
MTIRTSLLPICPRLKGTQMRTSQTPRRSLQATLALVALGVTTLLAPATSAIASSTHPQAPRIAHTFTTEAVLPSDPRELLVAAKVDEAI